MVSFDITSPRVVSVCSVTPDVFQKNFALGEAEVFDGGPVDKEKLIIAAWDWKDNAQTFRLHFGIDISKAESLREENKNIKIPFS